MQSELVRQIEDLEYKGKVYDSLLKQFLKSVYHDSQTSSYRANLRLDVMVADKMMNTARVHSEDIFRYHFHKAMRDAVHAGE